MPNPCSWEGALLDPPLGPTVDDQVTAIAAQSDRKPTTPIDVAVVPGESFGFRFETLVEGSATHDCVRHNARRA